MFSSIEQVIFLLLIVMVIVGITNYINEWASERKDKVNND